MKFTTSEATENIGLKLKQMRIDKGYRSYETFAIQNDLDPKYYWQVENGRNITIIHLTRLLKIHNITPSEFFKEFNKVYL